MYLTRLTLLDRPDLGALVRRLGDVYQEHQMLWQLFEPVPDAKRDFLYRRDDRFGKPRYFILSQRPPVNTLGLWQIDPPKLFQPKLYAGQRLFFMLRVNPVVTRNGKRHDVVMDWKQRLGWADLAPHQRPPIYEIIHQSGLEWLSQRSTKHGFRIRPETIKVEGYRKHRLNLGKNRLQFATLDFEGVLIVENPKLLLQSIEKGIGPAKAFGCGLMLIRRAQGQ